jgi:hypothetical protein
MPKGSTSDNTATIEWALKVFGGVKVAEVNIPGRGVVFGATVPGATLEDGKSLIGYGQTRSEAIMQLWLSLTGKKGTGIIYIGRLYEWSAGMFQEIIR